MIRDTRANSFSFAFSVLLVSGHTFQSLKLRYYLLAHSVSDVLNSLCFQCLWLSHSGYLCFGVILSCGALPGICQNYRKVILRPLSDWRTFWIVWPQGAVSIILEEVQVVGCPTEVVASGWVSMGFWEEAPLEDQDVICIRLVLRSAAQVHLCHTGGMLSLQVHLYHTGGMLSLKVHVCHTGGVCRLLVQLF